jgi:superfamily II DNA/RNA helicase
LIIFTNSKKRVNELVSVIKDRKRISTWGLSGDMTQGDRNRAIDEFRQARKAGCLIATAVGERGMDVEDVSHIIVHEMPNNIGDYVHRIDRTARAGRGGKSSALFSTSRDRPISKKLAKVLSQASQQIPDWLQELADSTSEEAYRETRTRRSRY